MEPKFFILGVSIIIVNVNKGELQTCIFLKIFLRAPRAQKTRFPFSIGVLAWKNSRASREFYNIFARR